MTTVCTRLKMEGAMAAYIGRWKVRCLLAKTLARLIFACFFSCQAAFVLAQELRTWQDANGKFSVEGTLIKCVDGNVYLRSKDGAAFVISQDQLSAADQRFLSKDSGKGPAANVDVEEGADFVSPSIVVNVSDGQRSLLLPAIVYGERAGKSFVVANTLQHVVHGFNSHFPDGKPLKFEAIWLAGGKRQKLALTEVMLIAPWSKWVLQGPASKLPEPLSTYAPLPATIGSRVELLGYEIDPRSNSFALSYTPAQITNVSHDAAGKTAYFTLDTKLPKYLPQALVFDAKGQLAGIADAAAFKGSKYSSRGVNVGPIGNAFFWEEPFIADAYLFPIGGDSEKIVWQVAVEYSDPLKKLKNGVVLVKAMPDPSQGQRLPKTLSDPLLTAEGAGVSQVELKKGTMSEAAQKYLQDVLGISTSTLLVGQWEEKNPTNLTDHSFDVQGGYVTAEQSTPVWAVRQKVDFVLRDFKEKKGDLATLPDMPAFGGTGSPPAQPKLKEKVLTSSNTVPKIQVEAELPPRLPKPEPMRVRIAGRLTQIGPFATRQINLGQADPQIRRVKDLRLAISPDEKWLYVVDVDAVLFKIDSRNLKVETSLNLPAVPTEIKFAKPGMLLAFKDANQLWKLNPETLEVLKVYTVPAISSLAANADSDLCFAIATLKNHTSSNLWMLNLASNQLLHDIPLERSNENPRDWTITLCAKGKYLFFKGDAIRRYRIQDTDVILEDISRLKHSLDRSAGFCVRRQD